MTIERDLQQWLQANLSTSPQLSVGFGDDAAVLRQAADNGTVVTTDLLTDGVDFLLDEVDPRLVGHKALGVNLSDLAAMASRPVVAFVSLALPRDGTAGLSCLELAIELYRGMLPLADRYELVIAGGDTNTWDAPLVISITVLGETTEHGPLTRSGGQAGDLLLATGTFGGSILGRHLRVEPRVSEALLLHDQYELHAGIDVSDGLSLDTARLAAASGVGAQIDLSAIPIADAACRLSEQDKKSSRDHALGDGEDFELILAVPPAEAERILRDQPLELPIAGIGELVDMPGLWGLDLAGQRVPLDPQGYQHRGNA